MSRESAFTYRFGNRGKAYLASDPELVVALTCLAYMITHPLSPAEVAEVVEGEVKRWGLKLTAMAAKMRKKPPEVIHFQLGKLTFSVRNPSVSEPKEGIPYGGNGPVRETKEQMENRLTKMINDPVLGPQARAMIEAHPRLMNMGVIQKIFLQPEKDLEARQE